MLLFKEFQLLFPIIYVADITAALGLCLENMSREELDRTKDVMHNILQGVSCIRLISLNILGKKLKRLIGLMSFACYLQTGRLENPGDLVRKMASSIAFMFSEVIDPKNLLYLDDSFTGNAIDWESELQTAVGGVRSITSSRENGDGETKTSADSSRRNKEKKDRKSKDIANFVLADPDEMVDLATLNCGTESDKDDDNASVSSDNSSVTSLEPYDLLDDDKDLGKQFTHLVDVVGALRKTNDADGVSN